ncbi:hypothetical protein cyc_02668 [Cyclospora cayetanensis]|uniref:Uncharacterized protein n=1 Tax=Cyclospora cayetanensis TaxID=88456 RepID=A0A1D3DA43_9EIME|nr:hypothetical protein cyc_02668 [Cyclospora cayetanensis]
MEKRKSKRKLGTFQEADASELQEPGQQIMQQQQQQHPARDRQKVAKKIRHQEERRKRDVDLMERRISELHHSLKSQGDEEDEVEESQAVDLRDVTEEDGPTTGTQRMCCSQLKAEITQRDLHGHCKRDAESQSMGESLDAFSSAIASLLEGGEDGSATVLSRDQRVFADLRNQQVEEKVRKEVIAERRLKRSQSHRQPSEADPEEEANLKRLATKGTVRFLNVLMASRRRATGETRKRKPRKTKRFIKRKPDKQKLISNKFQNGGQETIGQE